MVNIRRCLYVIIAISLLIVCTAYAISFDGAPYSNGDGTRFRPYLIKSAAELAEFRDTVNSGESYENVFFQLTNDIILNLDGELLNEWLPIMGFSGTLDGAGHRILGLYIPNAYDISQTDQEDDSSILSFDNRMFSQAHEPFEYGSGLFSYLKGVVMNLTVQGCIETPGSGIDLERRAAGIAAFNEGSIIGCTAEISFVINDFCSCSGIASVNDGLIENCVDKSIIIIEEPKDFVGVSRTLDSSVFHPVTDGYLATDWTQNLNPNSIVINCEDRTSAACGLPEQQMPDFYATSHEADATYCRAFFDKSGWLWPAVALKITQPCKINIENGKVTHNGIDIAHMTDNDPVVAVKDGTIVQIKNDGVDYQYGNAFYDLSKEERNALMKDNGLIILRHETRDGIFFSSYVHTQNNSYGEYTPDGEFIPFTKEEISQINSGKKIVQVKQGQQIALLGNTGCSSFAHLHFSIFRYNEKGKREYVISTPNNDEIKNHATEEPSITYLLPKDK